MLYQGTTTTNGGTLTIKNMTNSVLSQSAIDAIGSEMLDVEGINNVTVISTHEDEETRNNEFDVFETNSNNNYLFSVSNDGTAYSK